MHQITFQLNQREQNFKFQSTPRVRWKKRHRDLGLEENRDQLQLNKLN